VISFTDPVWLAEVRAWIGSQVTIAGEVEQPHVRAWSTVLRVPTTDGVVWFKAPREAFAFEARLLERLEPLAADLLPVVIATRRDLGWFLLEDAGLRAREHPVEWKPLLRRYAELQLAATTLADELVELGVVDGRAPDAGRLCDVLPPATAEALRRRLPDAQAAFDRLRRSPLAPTIDHGDLHDGNVFARDGHARLLDWGDATVAHPFMSLTVEEDPSARDAYVAPWLSVAPRERVLEDLDDMLAVRFLVRALNQLRIRPYDEAAAVDGVELRVRLFLEG